jgi:hypothetical protein
MSAPQLYSSLHHSADLQGPSAIFFPTSASAQHDVHTLTAQDDTNSVAESSFTSITSLYSPHSTASDALLSAMSRGPRPPSKKRPLSGNSDKRGVGSKRHLGKSTP